MSVPVAPVASDMAVTSTVARVGRTMEPSGIACPTVASVSAPGVVRAACVMSAAAEMTARSRVPATAEVAAAATARVTAAAAPVLCQRRRRAQD